MRLAFSAVVIAFVALEAVGCQACLDDGSQPKEQQPPTSSTRPIAEGPAKMRPKLIAPKLQFVDASDDQ